MLHMLLWALLVQLMLLLVQLQLLLLLVQLLLLQQKQVGLLLAVLVMAACMLQGWQGC